MDNSEFSHTIYEVISENTQKYSSTAISGGEFGRPVASSTTHYSDQALWLKDLATGTEQKFEFETFNVAAREGHKLLCIWRQPEGELEAVKNLNTDSTILGINNFSKANVCTWFGIVVISLVISLLFLIPYLGSIFCFVSFLTGRTPIGNLKTRSIPYYRVALLVAALAYLAAATWVINHVREINSPFEFIRNVYFANVVLVFFAYTVANNYVVTGRKKLKVYISTVNLKKFNEDSVVS